MTNIQNKDEAMEAVEDFLQCYSKQPYSKLGQAGAKAIEALLTLVVEYAKSETAELTQGSKE